MSDNGTKSAILSAWQKRLTATYELGDGLQIVYQKLDVLGFLVNDLELINPLLAALQEAMGQGGSVAVKDILGAATQQPETVQKLYGRLNDLMKAVVVEPQLKEQGFDNGISVNQIPTAAKFGILMELIGGGELVSGLQRFHGRQGQSMVIGDEGKAVRDFTLPTDGD